MAKSTLILKDYKEISASELKPLQRFRYSTDLNNGVWWLRCNVKEGADGVVLVNTAYGKRGMLKQIHQDTRVFIEKDKK